ncbi:hypothetical protein BD560DRAFT_408238 [Blakeslea trispora]|nr:hypothetical protein BD560DRAFT_408238 [Blakeslea trispora]
MLQPSCQAEQDAARGLVTLKDYCGHPFYSRHPPSHVKSTEIPPVLLPPIQHTHSKQPQHLPSIHSLVRPVVVLHPARPYVLHPPLHLYRVPYQPPCPKEETVLNKIIEEEDSEDEEMSDLKQAEKPRWSQAMRASLFQVIVAHKGLSDMTSFDWTSIGQEVGRSGKACKDQWRRAILPRLQQSFELEEEDDTLLV